MNLAVRDGVMDDSKPLNTEKHLRDIDRIVVMGTTLAGEVARALEVRHIELDYYRFRG